MSKQLHYDDETGSTFDYNYAEAYISDEEDAYCDDEHHSNSSLIVLTTSSPIRFHSKHEHLVRCDATASSSSSHQRRQHLPPVSGSRSAAGDASATTPPLSMHGSSSEAATSTPKKLQPATAASVPTPLPLAAATDVVLVRVHNPYSAEVLLPEHRDLWLADYNLQYADELAELDAAAAACDGEDLPMDAGSAEPLSMCCYFKQFGQCRMARSCWHGHAGFAHTPCHYGVNCRIAEHRAVAKAAEQAAWEAAAAASDAAAPAAGANAAAARSGPVRYAHNHLHPQEQHAYSSYRHAYARGAGSEHVAGMQPSATFSHPHHHGQPAAHPHSDAGVTASDAAAAMPVASQPLAAKHAAPQPSTLVPANFPCAYCDKTGKVMTQEIPIYEGSKVLKTIRVLCGNCLRTYQI